MRTKFITDTSHFSQIASALVVKTGAGSVKNVHHVVAEDYSMQNGIVLQGTVRSLSGFYWVPRDLHSSLEWRLETR